MPLFTHGPHDGCRWPDGTRLAPATLDYPGWAWTVEVLGWGVEIAGSNIGEAIAGAEAACAAVAGEPVRLNVGQTEDAAAYMFVPGVEYGRCDVGRGVLLTPHEAECLGVRPAPETVEQDCLCDMDRYRMGLPLWGGDATYRQPGWE